jgi:hypothetical protein
MKDPFNRESLAKALSVFWQADVCHCHRLSKQMPATDTLLQQLSGHATATIGLQLNPLHELLHWLTAWTRIPLPLRHHGAVLERLRRNQLTVVDMVAVYPGLQDARFLFPAADRDSQVFLFQSVFRPRRYAYPLLKRVILRVSCRFMRVFGGAPYFFSGLCLLVRNDRTHR